MRGQNNTPKIVMLTPDEAVNLLEYNRHNRPLNEQHVKRIARQIIDGKWRFNGDTIKISTGNDILDGQHRLWAVVEAKMPIETILIRGIEPEAFSTIDTLRKPRSGSDILAMVGVTGPRSTISVALQWLIRWQRKTLESYRDPVNRIENSDIEQAYTDNPGIARAAERAKKLRGITNTGLLAFFYYVLSNRNPDLAERMMFTLENPTGVPVNDPFFRLRGFFMMAGMRRADALTSVAIMVKAANAAHKGDDIKVLSWRNQGSNPEDFPKLNVGRYDSTLR